MLLQKIAHRLDETVLLVFECIWNKLSIKTARSALTLTGAVSYFVIVVWPELVFSSSSGQVLRPDCLVTTGETIYLEKR
jgi:hypothetical protein